MSEQEPDLIRLRATRDALAARLGKLLLHGEPVEDARRALAAADAALSNAIAQSKAAAQAKAARVEE